MSNEVTVQQLSQKIDELGKQKQLIDDLEADLSREKKLFENLKSIVLTYLNDAGMTTFKNSRVKVTKALTSRVVMPKDSASREKFFAYMREKGLYDANVTVNHMTLHKLYKEQREIAAEAGDIDWQWPGTKVEDVETLRVGRA